MRLAKVALPVLTAIAVFGMFKFASENGTTDLLESAIASGKLPDSSHKLITHWTGVPVIDRLLSTFVVFFAPGVDGAHPTYSMQLVHFSGQLMAM